MSEKAWRKYLNHVYEVAEATLGSEVLNESREHITRTTEAVYSVKNYHLEPTMEPTKKLLLKEE
jgi:hypothetical protein